MRILICDDEQEMREILSRFLEPVASQIDEVEELHSALELARVNQYHVILLDLRLRNSGKEEALHAIREFKSHGSSVVVVSGLPEPKLKDECIAAGCDYFLPKDGDFTSRALLMATYVATTKLPKSSYTSDSFLSHVEMLKRMVEAT